MADPFNTSVLPDPMPTAIPARTLEEDKNMATPSALPPPVPSPVPAPEPPAFKPEDRTLEEVYAGRRAMDFDEQITGNNNPFGDQWSSAKSYRQEGKDITAMLADRDNLGGVAPDVVDLASESYDPQSFKDMATNWRATAFMLDTPVEMLKDSDYTLYKKLVAAKLGKNAPKTEGEYRQMLADHFNNRQVTEAALDDLNMMAVMDALNATNYGQEFPMVRDQGRTLSEWMAKYPELATPDRQWLLARNAGEMYRNTIDDLKDVRQFAAPTFKTLVAFTQGNATEEQLDELGRNLRDLTPEQFTKVSQYVSLAAEAEQIDRGAWAQLAKNLGESLSRGFDWIPATDIFSGQAEAANRLKAVEKDDVWVPVDSESLPAGEYQNPRTARELPKYLQIASMGKPDETGYEEPLQNNWRKATPEEKELIRQNAEEGMKSMKMVRKLRNLAKTGVDPIKPLAQGGLLGAVERGAYGLAGSIPLMGAVAVNPFFGVLAYQQNELDRILLENEDMDLGAASTLALVEGGMNAVIDRFQLASLAGKSKVFGGVLKGMQKGGVANYLKRVGVIQVEQFAQEGAQDMIAPVVETIVASLREDMPDKDFMQELGNWWETRPEVFFATLPLALIGGGFASTGNLKNVNTEVTRERLRGAGISEEKIETILASTTRAEMDERIQEAWQSRTEEDKARGLEYLNQQLQQIKQTDTDHNLSVERKEDGTAEWIVTDYKGEEVGRFGDMDAAMEVISQNTSANLTNEKSTIGELLNWASKVLENPDISTDEKPVSVAQVLQEMEGMGNQKGIDNLMARLKFGDLQGKDPNKLYILGETTIEQVRDGVYRAVIKLKENASPRDALEEINHGFFKVALANGTYTLDTYQKWLEQTEAATGRELKRATEMEVIESLAQVTEDFVMGRIDETSMPQSFVDYIKRIAAVFKEALARFLKMDEAFKTGAIDTDFQTALEQSIGINPQVRLDRISDQTAASIDPNLSVRDTSGNPDERASDPATESGDPAPDVKIDKIDPDKQTGKEWKEIPWTDDWNYSVRVLPTSFLPMDSKLFKKIKKESGGIIRSVFIDRMKAGGEYLGIPLQGGMGFPTIVENLKAGVAWAFNSKATARALYKRAMDSGGYLALTIMVEGNVIGNKSFAMMWFEQLRRNIAAKKLTTSTALAELNRLREKFVTEKVDALRDTNIQKTDKKGKLKFNKDGTPVYTKEKIQAKDEKGDFLFTKNGNPAWEKVDAELTGHSTPWKTIAEAEKAILAMPQGIRGTTYFKKTFNKKKNQADYQELLTKTNTKAGFPDAVQMVKDVEEPSFAGLPAQTIVGIIKIDKVPKGIDPAMTAAQLGVPEHKSYKFLLKGKPVARMMKFRTLAEVKPSIAKQMMSQDKEQWKMDDLIAYSVKETKKSADQIAKIVGAMSASDIRTKLESSKLTPTPRMVAMLGEFPEYLEPIVSYMMDKRQDLVDGKVSPRDVAKAYWMTIASIGADAIDVATIGKKAQAEGISFNPDSMFTTTGTRGQLQMRPEELAAYWLGTPEGQRALDNVEKGVFNPEDWETGLLLRDAFGRNDLRERWRVTGTGEKNTNQTIMVDGNAVQVEVNDNGKWSFSIDNKDTPVELPEGLTEGQRVQTSGAVGSPKAKKANLTNLLELTSRINAAKGDPEKLEKAVMSAVGIGEGKKGFVSHFLGFGGWSTIDAVELNIWLAGVGDTTRADEDQKMIAAIAKKASGQAATRRDLFERIREAILGLRDKAKGGKKIPKEVAPHIIHHWIWDAAKDIQTTHEGLYYAMQNYSIRENNDVERIKFLSKELDAMYEAGATNRMIGTYESELESLFQKIESQQQEQEDESYEVDEAIDYKDWDYDPTSMMLESVEDYLTGRVDNQNQTLADHLRGVVASEGTMNLIPNITDAQIEEGAMELYNNRLALRDQLAPNLSTPFYSIREQGEIDRVAAAVDAVNRGPEGRLAVYQRAKLKFLQLMQANRDALDAIKTAAITDPAPALEKLEEDRAGRLADIETEEIAEVQSALQDNAVQFATRIENASSEDKAQLNADAKDRAKILEKGIRDKYAERKKKVEQEITAEKRKVSEVSESRRVASNAVYKEKVKYEKLAQAVAELDGLLKVLPREVIGKVGGFATLTKIGGGEKALADFFVKRVEMVDAQLERYLNEEYDQELDRIFERAKPKKAKAGEKPKGIGAEIQNLFAILKEARDFSAREVSAHLAGIDDKIATGELTAEEEAALKQEAALVTLVGNWKPKYQGYTDPTTGKISYAKVDNGADSNRRATAIAALRETWARGFADYRAREIAKREQRETEQRMAIQSTGKTGDMTKRKDKQLADAGLGAKFRNALFNLVSWDQFTALLFGNNSAVANRVSDLQRRADNQKEDAIQQKAETIEDLFTRLAGGNRLDGESLRWEMSQISMVVDGLKLSELEGLTATMMWMQADGKRHMEGRFDENGNRISAWGYTQEFIDKIEGALSPEAKEVRQFLLDNYAKEYSRINAVYRQLNGIDLPQIKNYSPLIVAPQNAPMGMVTDPVTGNAVSAASVSPGALRTRGTATAEPQFRDALQTFIAHTKQMEHWMAYAPMLSEVNGILRNREVQSAIEEKGGIEAKKVLNLWLDLFAQGGNRDASNQLDLSQQITGMAGRGAQMALVGRLGTLLVQTTQLGAAIAEMPTGSYVVRLSKLLTGNLGWGEALNSPYVQRRIREMPPVIQQALEGLAATQPNRLKYEVARIGRLISGTDGLMTAGTFAIVFDYHFTQAKKMGFSEADAREFARNVAERATDRLAQPTRMGARSIFELTQTNAYAKVGWAFASEARKNLALAAYATANKSAGEATRTIAGLVFLNIIFSSLIRNAWKDARDEEDDEWFDDRNWSVKRMLLAAATEPFYGLPFIGAAIEEGAYVAAGEYNMTGSILSPTRAIRAMMKLPDTLSGERDIEDMMKDLQAVLSVMGLFNQNLAATTSLSNIAIDAFTLGKNAKENLQN